jgi:hypothetical protein
MASPRLKNPSVAGIGNMKNIVVTQTKAVITAAMAIKAVDDCILPLNTLLIMFPP